ncbi:Low copy number virion structural protein [Bacillus tianshenii]|nr:Low copy number virion structural protein [Bacillus tianshenii]
MVFETSYLGGGRLDPPFYPTKPKPYTLGRRITIPNGTGPVIDSFTLSFDVELIAVAVDARRNEELDRWDLKVNSNLVIESSYIKRVPQGIYLMAIVPVKAGEKIELIYHNDSGSNKSVAVDFSMLRD